MAQLILETDQLHALIGKALEAQSGVAVDALAALCCALGLDPTVWPLSATTTGRVLTSMGRQVAFREAAVACGAIQIFSTTALTAVPAVPVCIDPQLPPDMEGALLAAGVEPDAVNTLYFDAAHGPVFRQRIKGKWRTFCDLVTRGLVQNPTGFFVAAVRRNWMLSSSYVPGLKVVKADPAVELRVVRERAAFAAQAELDSTIEASPAGQWASRGAELRLLLRGWSRVDLGRLEGACVAGVLRAADLAREAARAQAGGVLSVWSADLHARLI